MTVRCLAVPKLTQAPFESPHQTRMRPQRLPVADPEPGQAGRGLGEQPGYVGPAVVRRREQQREHDHVTLAAVLAGERGEHLQRGRRRVAQEGPAGLEPGQPVRAGPGPGQLEQFRDGRPGPRVPAAVRDRDQRRGQEVWMPHSVLPVPVHRPLRGSDPGATFIVQVAHPMEGYPSYTSGFTSTPFSAM